MSELRNLKQIKNGFADFYYLSEQGLVYIVENDQIKKIKRPYSDHCFSLKTNDNRYIKKSQRSLFQLVFNKPFCNDLITDEQNQQWKHIKNTNYYVSNHGRIKGYSYRYRITEPLQASLNRDDGYQRVTLMINGIKKNQYVHRLVALSFLQTPQDVQNYQVHHKDGNHRNNHVQNLVWITKQEHRQIHRKKKSSQ